MNRNEAVAYAYELGAYTIVVIAEFFGVHYLKVGGQVQTFQKSTALE